MKTNARWILPLVSIATLAALASPAVVNNMIRLHAQTDASFPATTPDTTGGILFGLTSGVPKWSPGDGGSWQTFGGGNTGWTSDGTTTTTTQNVTATTGTIILNGAATFFDSSSNGWRPYTTGAGGDFILYTPSGAGAFALQVVYGYRVNAAYGYITAGGFESTVGSGSSAITIATNGARIDYGAGASDYASSDGTTVTFAGPLATAGALSSASSATKGQLTLNGGGTATQTVLSGAICTCSNTATLNAVRCNVSGVTLTATGTAADVINYTCL